MKNTTGFSLVELIVVIAMMAILAAVAVIGVSIYIPKAQQASDNELLNVLSDALVAACLSEGVDQKDVTATIAVDADGKLAMNGTDIAIQISGTSKADKIADLFNDVVTDKNAKFNIINGTRVKFENGKFGWDKGTNSVYDGLEFSKDDIDAIKGSNFDKLGAEVLLDKIGLATDILDGLSTGDNAFLKEKVDALIFNPDNMVALAKSLGYDELTIDDIDDEPMTELGQEFYADFGNLVEQKMAMLKETHKDMAEPDLRLKATTEILSNNAVLAAATNKSSFNTEDFAQKMASGDAKDEILANLTNGSPSNVSIALSQAAMVYGMYTSYAVQTGIQIEGELDIQDVLEEMDKPGFKDYMREQAQSGADLNAYNSALNMIDTSAQNEDAVRDVLLNGFDNDNLSGVMKDALGDD